LSYRTPFVVGLELETPEDEEEASVAHGPLLDRALLPLTFYLVHVLSGGS
jgi:hypothetical protein